MTDTKTGHKNDKQTQSRCSNFLYNYMWTVNVLEFFNTVYQTSVQSRGGHGATDPLLYQMALGKAGVQHYLIFIRNHMKMNPFKIS